MPARDLGLLELTFILLIGLAWGASAVWSRRKPTGPPPRPPTGPPAA